MLQLLYSHHQSENHANSKPSNILIAKERINTSSLLHCCSKGLWRQTLLDKITFTAIPQPVLVQSYMQYILPWSGGTRETQYESLWNAIEKITTKVHSFQNFACLLCLSKDFFFFFFLVWDHIASQHWFLRPKLLQELCYSVRNVFSLRKRVNLLKP